MGKSANTIAKVAEGPYVGAADVLSKGQISSTLGGVIGGALGGPAQTANVNPDIKKSRDIDPNKYINEAPTSAPLAAGSTAQGAIINQSAANQARGYQDFLSQQLAAETMGQGPSLAQGQYQSNLDQALAAQNAAAANARGGNMALGQRAAALGLGTATSNAANQAAQQRAQEILNAQGALAQNANATRNVDATLAAQQAQLAQNNQQFNAGLQQSNSQFNANQQQQLDNLRLQYMQMGLTADEANQAADTAFRQSQLGIQQANMAIDQANTAAKNASTGQMLGTAGTLGAAGIAAFSDKKMKKDIVGGDKTIKAFLDAIAPHTYQYKDQAHGKGQQTSVMAQDLEKTSIGKQMVEDTPEGKMVNYGKGMAAILAAQAHLNARLKELEAAQKKNKAGGKK